MAATYSFLDVYATLVDAVSGANLSIGSGAGVAEEGITISQIDSIGHLQIGADGTPMQSLQATRGARLTLRLLKTSPVNAQLMALAETQRTSGALWGQNTITITNIATGDKIANAQCAFDKLPDNNYDKPGRMFEWTFLVGNNTSILGINV